MKLSLLLAGGGVAGLIGGALAWFFYAPLPKPPQEPAASRTLTLGGLRRSFLVHAPPTLKSGAPVLLVLHGSLMDGPKMRAMLGASFERLARERGAVVVYPTGFEGHFNDGRLAASYSARTLNLDDVGFARAIVDALAAEHKIDRQRVYALGYSNGGAMVMRLAAEAPDLVSGIIVVNANVPTPDNMGWTLAEGAAAARVRAVLIEGTKDPINPYGGGRVTIFGFGDRGTVLSALESARWFARRGGLDAAPVLDSISRIGGLDVQQQDWGAPARVRLLTLKGAGHTVPQSGYRFPRFLGATVRDDALLDAAWRLLDRPPSDISLEPRGG
jgi:polyhydroxybutyrate depolymerase